MRKGLKDFALCTVSALAKSDRVLGRPVHVTIEPTTACNLRCPVCETGAGILRREQGSLSLDNFKAMIDGLGRQVNTLFFYFMGEPFLNKESYDMIRHASDKGVWVSACTNGEPVNTDKLVDSGIDEVGFQVGGMSQETHEIYRVGGNLAMSLMRMYEAMAKAVKENKDGMKFRLGFIVMKHNEHEVELAKKLERTVFEDKVCRNLKVDIIDPCVRTMEQGRQFLPEDDSYWFYDREAFNRGILRPKKVPNNRCLWIYYSTVITWDGKVLPCCRDAHGEYVMGNILEQDFGEIWNGERYREFRRRIATDQANVGLCRLCSGFGVPMLH